MHMCTCVKLVKPRAPPPRHQKKKEYAEERTFRILSVISLLFARSNTQVLQFAGRVMSG